jgi:hypothetical protein
MRANRSGSTQTCFRSTQTYLKFESQEPGAGSGSGPGLAGQQPAQPVRPTAASSYRVVRVLAGRPGARVGALHYPEFRVEFTACAQLCVVSRSPVPRHARRPRGTRSCRRGRQARRTGRWLMTHTASSSSSPTAAASLRNPSSRRRAYRPLNEPPGPAPEPGSCR